MNMRLKYPQEPIKIVLNLSPVSWSRCTGEWKQEAKKQVEAAWEDFYQLPVTQGLIVRCYVSNERSDLDNLYASTAQSLIPSVLADDRVRFVPRIYVDYRLVKPGRERIEMIIFPPFIRDARILYLQEVARHLNLKI